MLREARISGRLLAVLMACAISVLATNVAAASAQNFEQSLWMRITTAEGKRIVAKGATSGTVEGKVSLRLRTIDGSKVRAVFFGSDSHGTVRGTGTAKYSVDGAISSYTGRITTLEGTGRYANARSRGIYLSGTANRRTFKMRMKLSGKWDV